MKQLVNTAINTVTSTIFLSAIWIAFDNLSQLFLIINMTNIVAVRYLLRKTSKYPKFTLH